MIQVRIENITGGTYPINVYISDIYGNNRTLIGVINSGPVPPLVRYNTTIPSVFNTAPQVIVSLEDSGNCEKFKILDCTFGCAFEIIITDEDCVVIFDVTTE
jgi:hypothetical protein